MGSNNLLSLLSGIFFLGGGGGVVRDRVHKSLAKVKPENQGKRAWEGRRQ